MRVLIFMQSLGIGGVGRQFFMLGDHLVLRGHQVSVAALHARDPHWKWYWSPGAMPVETFYSETPTGGLSAGLQLVGAVRKLRRLLRTQQIQVLYAVAGPISLFIAWLATRGRPGTRLIWGARTAATWDLLDRGGRQKGLLSHLCALVSPTVPLLVSNSEAGATAYRARGYRCKRYVVIPNGIDAERFRPDAEARQRLRASWHKSEDTILMGLVGRLAPEKGHPVFLKAAAILAGEREDVDFLCVGDGPEGYRKQLQQLSRDLGLAQRLFWAGSREDMPAVYNALDVLCSSSDWEGFPNVIGEAMACGVPCVATAVGDSARIVGDAGVMVPPNDPEALAAGLRTQLARLEKHQPWLPRARIVEHFGVEAMVDATEQVLLETLST